MIWWGLFFSLSYTYGFFASISHDTQDDTWVKNLSTDGDSCFLFIENIKNVTKLTHMEMLNRSEQK